MTMRVAARNLEPWQGVQGGKQRQGGCGGGGSGGSGQRQKQKRKRQREKQQQNERSSGGGGGGDATIQTAANTVDVRGQRAVEVSWPYM